MTDPTTVYDNWLQAVDAEFVRLGITDMADAEPETWLDSFKDGLTPVEAVDEEVSCWTAD